MNSRSIAAILLVMLGLVILAYSGVSFTAPGREINFLGLHIETTQSYFVPPVVGALALVGGIMLLLAKPRKA